MENLRGGYPIRRGGAPMFLRNILARMPRAAFAERPQQPISRARSWLSHHWRCHVLSALPWGSARHSRFQRFSRLNLRRSLYRCWRAGRQHQGGELVEPRMADPW